MSNAHKMTLRDVELKTGAKANCLRKHHIAGWAKAGLAEKVGGEWMVDPVVMQDLKPTEPRKKSAAKADSEKKAPEVLADFVKRGMRAFDVDPSAVPPAPRKKTDGVADLAMKVESVTATAPRGEATDVLMEFVNRGQRAGARLDPGCGSSSPAAVMTPANDQVKKWVTLLERAFTELSAGCDREELGADLVHVELGVEIVRLVVRDMRRASGLRRFVTDVAEEHVAAAPAGKGDEQ